uniref:F-box domain-containing protein n=2 Tax=Caenorhabditis tropicalis TaxID=1561998 RepID=A0A1I7T871_9PELO
MKLFNFPFVVQREIIKKMSISEVFLLSLCSSKTTDFIHRIRWKELKSIRFSFVGSILYVTCEIKNVIENEDIFEIRRTYQPRLPMHKWTISTILGVETCIGFIKVSKKLKQLYVCLLNETLDGPIAEAIQKQIELIFGNHLKYELRTHDTSEGFLPKLTNIRNSILSPNEAKRLDEMFSASPNHDLVVMLGPIGGRFPSNSGIYNTKLLKIGKSGSIADDVLYHFKGKRAHLLEGIVSQKSIIHFIQKWISNERFHNLEMFSVKVPDPNFFENAKDEIKKHFAFHRFDPKEIPAFRCCENFVTNGYWEHPPLVSGEYVVRDSDGSLASVDLYNNIFSFVVLNSKVVNQVRTNIG